LPFSNANIDQGGVLWFSALIRRDGSASRLELGFVGDTNTVWQPPLADNLSVRSENGGSWTLTESAGSTSSSGVSPVNGTSDYLVVRFDMAGTSSTAHLWVNPSNSLLAGADLATGTADASLTGLDADAVGFRNLYVYLGSGTGEGSADEFRFGTDFAAVSPVPEPSAALLLFGAGAAKLFLRRRRRDC